VYGLGFIEKSSKSDIKKKRERKKTQCLLIGDVFEKGGKRHGSEDNASVSWKKSHFAQRLDNASRV